MVSSGHRFKGEFEEAEAFPEKEKQAQRASDFASYGLMGFTTAGVLSAVVGFFGEPWMCLVGMLFVALPALYFFIHMSEEVVRIRSEMANSLNLGSFPALISRINYLLELFGIKVDDLPSINSRMVRERLASQASRILKAQRDIVATDGFQGELEVTCENQKFKAMFDTFKYFGLIAEDEEYGPFFKEAKKKLAETQPA